ncbi:MAG: Gfo/Idh/MocA family oxidoreductase [Puniceicoccales bacterium]|jgi:predicted dehydrogenase|nr:Gfo/Idh/MocA family oxidoreductase [Puniceicoccales bacterium]
MKRRNFLTQSAGALAAVTMLPACASQQNTTGNAAAEKPTFQKGDGMNYAPQGKSRPVVKPGEFVFAAAHFDHGHINGMASGLTEAGGTLKWLFDDKPQNAGALAALRKKYPAAKVARSLDEILDDKEVTFVAAAAIPNLRGPIGCRVINAGKDYFTDKTPFTEIAQLDDAKAAVAQKKRKYMVYFSERLHTESGMYATDLIESGAIGKVVHVLGLGPHRLNKKSRPAWFFKRKEYGGILCDIGSHQFEQFLTYAGATDATVAHSAIANYNNPETPELEDFGEATLVGNNGVSNYVRVDWFTPDGLSVWGDGRIFIIGTKGSIELRKYVDVAREKVGDQVYLTDDKGEHHFNVVGKVGYRFFGELILDCLNRTEKAMTQAHAFKAAELCLKAQSQAVWLTKQKQG